MAEVIDDVFQAALHTLQASKPEDEAFVIVFNDRLELLQDFTLDRKALGRAIHKVHAGGQTAIYDAVHTALTHIRKGQYRKKALLVVMDGEDNSSGTTFRDLLDFAQENSSIIYVIGFFGDTMRFGSLLADSPSVEKLSRLAQVTGGPPGQAQNLIVRTRAGYYAASEPVGSGRFDAGNKPVFISGFFGRQF